MSSNNDPNAWLGLLKWSLSYQDGTEPSGVSTMSDEDRRWLERVVSEGVRDDVKTMTEIFTRLCDYLDTIACERHASVSHHGQDQRPPSVVPAEGTGTPGNSRLLGNPDERPRVGGEAASSSNASLSQPQPAPSAVLSTFLASSTTSGGNAVDSSSHQRGDNVEQSVAGGDGGVNDAGVERLECVLNDLEELRDIVEQIDMAATFVKIGGFGRLIALVGPGYRPEKLRLRAASVIATLTKNNPPAQSEFSTSGGHKALLDVVLGPDSPIPSLPSASSPAVEGEEAMVVSPLSFALQRAILHALSCSVMGVPSGEDSLCGDARFQAFLASALAQRRGNVVEEGGEGAKLRSKAAFVLKALVGAPGASVERVKSLWPAIQGLLIGLEALCDGGQGTEGDGDEGDGGITDAARETCIEALVAAAKSADGARIVSTLGSRVSTIMSRRRQVLNEARSSGSGTSEEALETAEIELSLWSQWDNVCGPAQ